MTSGVARSNSTMIMPTILILAANAVDSRSFALLPRPDDRNDEHNNNLRLRRPPVGRRRLRRDDEFCGQCTWSGSIVCEARAQILVRENGFATIQEARTSILDDCTGVAEVEMSLDAFCGACPWSATNFDCDSRVDFLKITYYLTEEEAKGALLEEGECVDPDYVYVAPNDAAIVVEDDGGATSGSDLSNAAAIGTIVVVTAVLMFLVGVFTYRRKKMSAEVPAEVKAVVSPPPPERVAPAHMPPSALLSKTTRKPRPKIGGKTISFALDKSDPPGIGSDIAPDEYDPPESTGNIAAPEENDVFATKEADSDAAAAVDGERVVARECCPPPQTPKSKCDTAGAGDPPATMEALDATRECTDESEHAVVDPEDINNRPLVDTLEDSKGNDNRDRSDVIGARSNPTKVVPQRQDVEDSAFREVKESKEIDMDQDKHSDDGAELQDDEKKLARATGEQGNSDRNEEDVVDLAEESCAEEPLV